MNLNSKTEAFIETTIFTAIVVILVLVGFYIFPITIILYPTPFVILGVRRGSMYSILSILASIIIISILTGIMTGILLFISFGIFALCLIYMIARKYDSFRIIMFGTVVCFISVIIAVSIFNFITETSLIVTIEDSFSQALEIQLDVLKNMGTSDYEIIQLEDYLQSMVSYTILLIPFYLIKMRKF